MFNSSDGVKTTKLIKYSTNFKNKNYLMLNINQFSVLSKETKGAVNEKLTARVKISLKFQSHSQKKNTNSSKNFWKFNR